MASENAKIDQNSRNALTGVTDDVAAEIRNLLIDPVTGRLKVTAVLTGLVVTSINGLTGAVTLAAGTNITLGTVGNTITITATGGSSQPFADNIALVRNSVDATKLAIFSAASITTGTTRTYTLPDVSGTVTVLGNTSTGSGSIVLATSPILVTPTLGVATATSINRVAFTQPATGATLTLADGKTLTVNNTMTFAGTDSRVYTFPTTNATIARTDAAQTFQGAQTFANAINGANGADIASAATTDIGAATGNYVNITGTTTITSLGTGAAGITRTVQFAGILTLTHNATSLILPTGANITTAAGDVAMFQSLGTGNWRCTGYMRANGQPLAGGGSTDIGCSLTSTTTSLSNTGAFNPMPWDGENYDTDAMHDNASNNSRIVFKTAGKYQINVDITTNGGNGHWAIRKNGSTVLVGSTSLSGINLQYVVFALTAQMAVNDYIEVGFSSNVTATTITAAQSHFSAQKIA